MSLPRFPFAQAISDPRLLKTGWDTFSPEQQAVLRMVYGLRLSDEDMAIWHALHGGGVYDELGYLKAVHDSGVTYVEGREYTDITLIFGRRAAKTCLMDFAQTYEALCGGHKARLNLDTELPVFLNVSQDLPQAMKSMREYILFYLKSSPAGLTALGDLQESVTQRGIKLEGCGIIKVGPPNLKVGRGDSVACAVLDEVAQWQKDERSASPDYEVEKSIEYGMSQFDPYGKRFKGSTPWTEEGLLWDEHQRGTHARFSDDPGLRAASAHKLVLQGPSPVLANPSITRTFLTQKRAKDPDAFKREILAQFAKAVSGFLPAELIEAAIDRGVTTRPFLPGIYYVAAIDPAFKRDAIPLCIGHLDGEGSFVQDALVSWRGTPEQPLDPGIVIPLIGQLCAAYGVRSVMSDQYHSTSVQTIASEAGFLVEEFILTPKTKRQVWTDTLTLLTQHKAHLLDHDELEKELLGIERILTPNGNVKIQGRRDDHAMVTAMCLHRAVQFGVAAPSAKAEVIEPTTDKGIAAVRQLVTKQIRMRNAPKPKAWWNR